MPEEIPDWMRALKDPLGLPSKFEALQNLLRGKVESIKKASGPAVLNLMATQQAANELMLQRLIYFD